MKRIGPAKTIMAGYLVLTAVLLCMVWGPSASAATLQNRSDLVTDPSPSATTSHQFTFTTASANTVASVTFTFPAGFNVNSATLGMTSGIGAGTVSADSSTVARYAVTNPVSLASGSVISILLQNVVNSSTTGAKAITIRTRRANDTIIDSGGVSVVINNATNISSTVQPVFVLGVSTGSLTFTVDPASSQVATATLVLTVETNTFAGTGGYTVRQMATQDLTGTAYSSATIPHWPGTASSPTAWNTTTSPNYWGVTRSAYPSDGGNYFGMTTTPETIMSGNGPTNGDTQTQTWKVAVDYLTPADIYTSTIYVVGTPSF